jgi:hypothetical protein
MHNRKHLAVLFLFIAALAACNGQSVGKFDENAQGSGSGDDCDNAGCGDDKGLGDPKGPDDATPTAGICRVTHASILEGSEMLVRGEFPEGVSQLANAALPYAVSYGGDTRTLTVGAGLPVNVIDDGYLEARAYTDGSWDSETEGNFPASGTYTITIGTLSCSVALAFDGSGSPTTPGVLPHADDQFE